MNTNREHPLNEASLPRPFALGSAASLYGSSLRPGWLILFLLLMPMASEANSGTPMMWATMSHLCIGNALIGAGEGWLISRFFRLNTRKSIFVMIGANYFSMVAGLPLSNLLDYVVSRPEYDLNNVRPFFILSVVSIFVVTIALELPFVAWLLHKVKHPVQSTLITGISVQFISYAVLALLYVPITSLGFGTAIVPLAELTVANDVELYFLSTDRREVLYKRALSSESASTIAKLDEGFWRLYVRRGEEACELLAVERQSDDEIVVKTDLNPKTVPGFEDMGEDLAGSLWPKHQGPVAFLGPAQPDWHMDSRLRSFEGLKGENISTGEEVSFGIANVFARWYVDKPTQLPNGDVIFELCPHQICIYEPDTKRVALLARGCQPVALLRATENESDVQANSVNP